MSASLLRDRSSASPTGRSWGAIFRDRWTSILPLEFLPPLSDLESAHPMSRGQFLVLEITALQDSTVLWVWGHWSGGGGGGRESVTENLSRLSPRLWPLGDAP